MTQTPSIAFAIDREARTPVFEQICDHIRQRVTRGDLLHGARLPATRALATELGVSRSTVVTAYEQLVAEGYLSSLQGSGYTIRAMEGVEFAAPNPSPTRAIEPETTPTRLPFAPGYPDMRLFPYRQWAKSVARVCRTNPQAMLLGGAAFGNFELRQAIAGHVAEWRGITADPAQIIVTAGSADALEICTRTLAERGEGIGLENPCYPPLRRFADARGLVTRFLPVDEHGAQLPRPEQDVRLSVLTPSHQFPLGGAMSPDRRQAFITWADRTGGWIIEDDYDSEFRYAGRPIPAMAGFDRLNRTIYVGSFSKIFSNTLRLGYLIVPQALTDHFRTSLERFGLRASYMPQQALAEFIRDGEFYRHLRRVRRTYGERRRYLLDRLTRDFSDVGSLVDHQAGMQVAFHLRAGLDDTTLAARAKELGLNVDTLSHFCATGADYNGFLLGYCGFSIEELEQALTRLEQIFDPSHRSR
ncbi:HTH-type transcriptional regulatory protein GabR [Falsiruegeria litorea R37]|uniref:HTH-type transcriptional regulatory protein GabR n=1 Tax=Falsiruegeria litorea R37 TaxID=1200284 RepID=A0A1Y5TN08_9RHOB|nr:PLP-dependent aminotransferase family protein [Falsiruegeria litorea]SLN67696.1 HTH-type transcriptional regulatory protein GabR [Falsiruegeria litorea R37]